MNVFIAWLAVLLVLLSASIWFLRILIMLKKRTSNSLIKIWKLLRRYHCCLGILSLIAVIIHCFLIRAVSIHKSPLGVFLLLCLITLTITGRYKMKLTRNWLKLHKIITVILLLGMLYHSFIEFIFF